MAVTEQARRNTNMTIISTWPPEVCSIIAFFYGDWAIILPTFGGLGMLFNGLALDGFCGALWGVAGLYLGFRWFYGVAHGVK